MKGNFVLALLLTAAFGAYAQLGTGESPVSFSMKDFDHSAVKTISMDKPDLERVMAEDASEEAFFKPRRFGVILPLGIDFFKEAQSMEVEEGRLWTLAVSVPEAQALILYSSDFYLPEHSKLFIYNQERTRVLGAFSAFNNHELATFATQYVEGERMILEYYQPERIKEKARIELSEIGYAYRDIEKYDSEYGSSGSCNVNVNCSEGDGFRNQQRGVCRIQLKLSEYYIGWCTSTLLNNTRYDRTPYLLTAAHCVEDVQSTSYYSQFVFYFNYETSGCSNPYVAPSSSQSLTGATLKVRDNSGGDSGSDYALFLLNNQVPQSYNPFWCGWDNRNLVVNSGVCIHHPSGDVKKISTFDSPVTTEGFGAAGTHWKVYWTETENGWGITEGGSSGAALFNMDGLVIGDLTGGWSDCNAPNDEKFDYFGKFSVSYPNMRQWLDPENTGAEMIWGMDYVSDLENAVSEKEHFKVYPMPAKDEINLMFDKSYGRIVISVYDVTGRKIMEDSVPEGSRETRLNVGGFANGIYVIDALGEGMRSRTKVVINN